MRGDNLESGDRVKLSARAFENGVYDNTPETREMRGTVLNRKRGNISILRIRWDTRRTPDYLHWEFLTKAEGPSEAQPNGSSPISGKNKEIIHE